jgi:hypothetical protein
MLGWPFRYKIFGFKTGLSVVEKQICISSLFQVNIFCINATWLVTVNCYYIELQIMCEVNVLSVTVVSYSNLLLPTSHACNFFFRIWITSMWSSKGSNTCQFSILKKNRERSLVSLFFPDGIQLNNYSHLVVVKNEIVHQGCAST